MLDICFFVLIPLHWRDYEPKEFDKITVDDPDLDSISDFLKTTCENTGLFGVATVFAISVLQVSRCDFDLSNERMPRENREASTHND